MTYSEARLSLLQEARSAQVSLLALQPLITKLQGFWQPPTSESEMAKQLDGVWELLYTSKPALERSGLDTLPGLERGRTYQAIESASGRVFNLADLAGPFGLKTTILVQAKFTLSNIRRICVQFERTAVVTGAIADYGSPAEAIRAIDRGAGWGVRLATDSFGTVDTLYVDEEVRIGLGNRGTLFVLSRAA
ncbi:MAG: hypothetical protein H7Y37_09110 [Anaerolineae bacterium]|nr:hypothetical protein [Gloeobacterales cyanobacterium ES-bin-313]